RARLPGHSTDSRWWSLIRSRDRYRGRDSRAALPADAVVAVDQPRDHGWLRAGGRWTDDPLRRRFGRRPSAAHRLREWRRFRARGWAAASLDSRWRRRLRTERSPRWHHRCTRTTHG